MSSSGGINPLIVRLMDGDDVGGSTRASNDDRRFRWRDRSADGDDARSVASASGELWWLPPPAAAPASHVSEPCMPRESERERLPKVDCKVAGTEPEHTLE